MSPSSPQSTRTYNCEYCDAALPSYSTKEYCDRLECRLKGQQEQLKQAHSKERNKTQRLEQKKLTRKQNYLEAKPSNDKDIPMVEVPYYRPGEEDISEERIASLEFHLRELLSTLDQVGEEKKIRSPNGITKQHDMGAVMEKACTLCNGWCCRQGESTHAFIQRSTLVRVLKNNSDLDEERLVALYKSYIPSVANKNSCIYHSLTGCSLSEELRADICGEFFCWNLDQHIEKYHDETQPSQTMIFAVRDYQIQDVNVVSSEGVVFHE